MVLSEQANNLITPLDAIAKLAFERPALTFCYPTLQRSVDEAKLTAQSSKDPGSHGPVHPTITVLLASIVELERRGLIDIGTTKTTNGKREKELVWVTKKSPYCIGRGTSAELFNCISHGRSPLDLVIAKYLHMYPKKNPWTLAYYMGIRDAKAFGYLTWQSWPVKGIQGLLSRMGLADDVKKVWVLDGLKVREATQASRLLRIHLNEFRSKSPSLYEKLRNSILQAICNIEGPTVHKLIKFPQLRKRLAN